MSSVTRNILKWTVMICFIDMWMTLSFSLTGYFYLHKRLSEYRLSLFRPGIKVIVWIISGLVMCGCMRHSG